MVRTAIQLFTLKDVEESIPDVVARVGESGFDGVEFYDAHLTHSRTRKLCVERALHSTTPILPSREHTSVSTASSRRRTARPPLEHR